MTLRYSVPMRPRHPLPSLWLVSDQRNDAELERILRRLPRGSGLIYRHYHLPAPERLARFRALRRLCPLRGHVAVWAGSPAEARRRGAAGSYGPPRFSRGARLATAHTMREIAAANLTGAALVLLSPVHPTRSHPAGRVLGPVRFLLLARRVLSPVIALGGMDRSKGRVLPVQGWAAIDGLSHNRVRNPLDS